jgi:hypothetical protein
MDIDVFVIFLEGTGNIGQMHNNIFTIRFNGISQNHLVTKRKVVKDTT